MLRSLRLRWTGVFCSKTDDLYENGMKVTQITSGANVLGAWGQTGANTANFVRSSLQSDGLLGAQCHLHMLGPFRKVPDRVTGAIFHALVQCVAPWGSQLYQNQNPICQLMAGALFSALLTQDLLAIYLQVFSLSPKFLGWLCLLSEPFSLKPHSGAPVSCLRSYCQPFRTLKVREYSIYLALTSVVFSFFFFPFALLFQSLFQSHASFPPTHTFIFSFLSCRLSLIILLYSLSVHLSFSLIFYPFYSSLLPFLSFLFYSDHLLPNIALPDFYFILFYSFCPIKGSWLIQTASPYTGLMTQTLWVAISPTQPRKQSWVWGQLQLASQRASLHHCLDSDDARAAGPAGTWVPLPERWSSGSSLPTPPRGSEDASFQ